MRKALIFGVCLLSLSHSVFAVTLPSLPANSSSSPHKLFISSQANPTGEYDAWKIDGGYAYSLFDSVDLYVGTRVDNTQDTYHENSFLSGISYNFNERVSLKSTLHTKKELLEDGSQESTVSAEVTSRVKLSKHIDLHATVDYEQLQQGIEVGLGFRF